MCTLFGWRKEKHMSVKSLVSASCPQILRPLFDRIEASPIGSRLARGVFWSMAGSVISRGLMFLATILVARILGKTVYGELGMIQSTVGMFGVFAGFGLGLTATKHVAEFRRIDPQRAGRIIGLSGLFAILTGGLMALGLFIFAPWLAANTINAPHLSAVLRIGALILFINALNGAQTGALAGFEAFRTIARVNLFIGLISFPVLVAGAYLGGLTGAVWALALNLCINWLLNHIALRMEAKRNQVLFNFKRCVQEWPVLWRFSLPAAFSGALVGPVNWVCAALLVNQPGGYGEMGIFSAANQWYAVLLFLPGMLGGVVLPVLSEQLGRNDTKKSSKTLLFAIKINALFVLPLVLFASIASPYIMSFYGEAFSNGWPTLIAVLLTAALVAVNGPVGQIIAASGKMWIGFVMNLGWAFAFLGFTYLLLGKGSLGIASARLGAYFLHTIWVLSFVHYLLTKTKKLQYPRGPSTDHLAEL